MRRAPDFSRFLHVHRGFTLVEMIISIVITGIVVSMVSLFGRQQINAYLDVGNRAALSDAADTALRRMARDLQSALPNSVRLNATNTWLEFVPISDAGRYRVDVDNVGGGNPLDFSSSTDNSFAVLGPTVNIANGEQLVIYNLGVSGSDVYEGSSRRAATAGTGLSTVSYTIGAQQFQFPSPYSRFQIVAQPVTYVCDIATGTLVRRTNYDFVPGNTPPANLASLGGTSSLLVDGVTDCSFNYTPAVLQRNGLVAMRLTLTRNGESVNLMHLVEVLNTP